MAVVDYNCLLQEECRWVEVYILEWVCMLEEGEERSYLELSNQTGEFRSQEKSLHYWKLAAVIWFEVAKVELVRYQAVAVP